jgi:hypothetical protein
MALQTGSDAEMIEVLQVSCEEMPQAMKTLQHALERVVEWEGPSDGSSLAAPGGALCVGVAGPGVAVTGPVVGECGGGGGGGRCRGGTEEEPEACQDSGWGEGGEEAAEALADGGWGEGGEEAAEALADGGKHGVMGRAGAVWRVGPGVGAQMGGGGIPSIVKLTSFFFLRIVLSELMIV